MTPENFTFWLQGFFEIGGGENLSPEQVQVIKDHLALVFNKVTPNRSVSNSHPFYLPIEHETISSPVKWDYSTISTSDSIHCSIKDKSGKKYDGIALSYVYNSCGDVYSPESISNLRADVVPASC